MDRHFHLRRLPALSLTALALLAAPVMAADEIWVPTGQPSGGQTFQVAVDPVDSGTLYALTNNGLFKSTDGGADWSFAYAMFGYDMSVDPLQPMNLYVANIDSGVWKSTDGGDTWSNLAGISNATVVVADPVTEGVVYAIGKDCAVYKSPDGGTTWSSIGVSRLVGNTDAKCTQIAVDAANPQVLYLSTEVGAFNGSTDMRQGSPLSGVYSSTDGGAHWSLNPDTATLGFADVVIDPSDDQNVYAGNYVSNDAGATWAPSSTTPTNFTVITVDPADSQVMWGVVDDNNLGDLWTSTDQGAHWNQVTSMPFANASFGPAIYNLAYDPSAPADVYAASMAFGVFHSSDGGATWAQSATGLAGVLPLTIFADSTGDIYMGTQSSGIFKSTDGGVTWAMKDDGIAVNLGSAGITSQALVETSTPGTLYQTDQNSFYKTTDGGDSWSPLTLTGGIGSINALAVDPQQPQTIYVGTGGNQVMKSIDGGASWSISTSGLNTDGVWALAVAPTDSKELFAGGFSTGLFKSTDGGVTWAESDSGMPVAFGIGCVAVDPTDPQVVYACPGNAGIWKSKDGGATWAKAGDLVDDAFRIVEVDPNDPNIVYAAIPGLGVAISTDGGVSWNMLGQPGSSVESRRTQGVATASKPRASADQHATISTIAVDPRQAGNLYGAADTGQVYALGATEDATTGGKATSGSSSGGGGFPLLCSLLLLGFVAQRRRAD